MTCIGKKSSEIKDELVLITNVCRYPSQCIQPNKFYKVAIWTFCVYTRYWQLINQLIYR